MQTARIALLLGHRDARMVERVCDVMDNRTLGRDVAAVFKGMALPSGYQMSSNLRMHVTG